MSAEYRTQVRKTFQQMSDNALAFQDARISRNDCIDRQEIDREIAERRYKRSEIDYGTVLTARVRSRS